MIEPCNAGTGLGRDHPDAPGSRNDLADADQSAGSPGRAIPPRETTLTDAERALDL